MTDSNDTICAVSTPAGTGGIAVIRVSGPQATDIIARNWNGSDINSMQSHTAHLGHITDSNGNLLDQTVLTLYRSPNSFTGEDVVEIACHGSAWIQQQLVSTLIDSGCRLAQPGEFTRRAFANGRMDLSQAEAVADVIAATSEAAHRVALNQMRGNFGRRLNELRDRLLQFVSLIELELDFSEEDVTFANRDQLLALAHEISDEVNRLALSYHDGNAIRNGIPVAIVGPTNAGKSTLLNALLGDDRALVSDIHGTTRDVIEDTVNMGGIMFRFIDTAGIRESDDTIEAMGIARSFTMLDHARIVLWVTDATTPEGDIKDFAGRILPHCSDKHVIAIVNKADLTPATTAIYTVRALVSDHDDSLLMSAHNADDVNRLRDIITAAAALPSTGDNDVIVTNARHYEALTRAGEAISRAIDGIGTGLSGDLVSQDIRECMHYLGTITGEITTTDILANIFAHFCIGK